MKVEEAIKRIIAMESRLLCTPGRHADGKALDMALSALRAQQEGEKNEPLTLEQLLEMDGQPVWVEEPDGYKHYSRWVLVDCAWKSNGLVYLHSWPGAITFETFTAKGGKIYRRPPEKE